MSVIQKGLTESGLGPIVGDALPKPQRGVKSFQRLIAAMRAAEAEVMDRLAESERELNGALQVNLTLHERIRILEAENMQHRLHKSLSEIEALTVGDRTRLLEVSKASAT